MDVFMPLSCFPSSGDQHRWTEVSLWGKLRVIILVKWRWGLLASPEDAPDFLESVLCRSGVGDHATEQRQSRKRLESSKTTNREDLSTDQEILKNILLSGWPYLGGDKRILQCDYFRLVSTTGKKLNKFITPFQEILRRCVIGQCMA